MSFRYAESGDVIFSEDEVSIHSWDRAPKACRVCKHSGGGRRDVEPPTVTDAESVALAAEIPPGAPWHYTKCSRCGAERGATAEQGNWHYFMHRHPNGEVHEMVPRCVEAPPSVVVPADIPVCSYCGHLIRDGSNCSSHPEAEVKNVQGFRVA